jgi:hypothetical protein
MASWYELLAIVEEAKTIDEEERSRDPQSCAVDYTPLRGAGEGNLYCPWCGLRWPEDASAWGEFPGAF